MANHFDHIAYINADICNTKGGIGGHIWGSGCSPNGARQQAIRNLNALEDGLADKHEILLIPCASNLYTQVRNLGGDVSWFLGESGKAYKGGSPATKAADVNVQPPVNTATQTAPRFGRLKANRKVVAEPQFFICYEGDVGGTIWGLGLTEEEASAEAWHFVKEYDPNLVNNLPLMVVACQKGLYDAFDKFSGTEIVWTLDANGHAEFVSPMQGQSNELPETFPLQA